MTQRGRNIPPEISFYISLLCIKNLSSKKFVIQNDFGGKKWLVLRNFESRKKFGEQKLLVKKNLVLKVCVLRNLGLNPGPKKLFEQSSEGA